MISAIIATVFVLLVNLVDSNTINKLDKTRYKGCDHLRAKGGYSKSGIYTVWFNDTLAYDVHCNHTDSASSVLIQRRMYGNIPFQHRRFSEYLYEFGDPNGDIWIGLNKIYYLTTTGYNVLYIEMQDWQGNVRNARYGLFNLTDSTRFHLQVGRYSGSVPDDLSHSNGCPFATYDKPDAHKCAVYQRTGWWYNYCAYALLNGHYYHGGIYPPNTSGYFDGIYWNGGPWGGFNYSLKYVHMVLSKQ